MKYNLQASALIQPNQEAGLRVLLQLLHGSNHGLHFTQKETNIPQWKIFISNMNQYLISSVKLCYIFLNLYQKKNGQHFILDYADVQSYKKAYNKKVDHMFHSYHNLQSMLSSFYTHGAQVLLQRWNSLSTQQAELSLSQQANEHLATWNIPLHFFSVENLTAD